MPLGRYDFLKICRGRHGTVTTSCDRAFGSSDPEVAREVGGEGLHRNLPRRRTESLRQILPKDGHVRRYGAPARLARKSEAGDGSGGGSRDDLLFGGPLRVFGWGPDPIGFFSPSSPRGMFLRGAAEQERSPGRCVHLSRPLPYHFQRRR